MGKAMVPEGAEGWGVGLGEGPRPFCSSNGVVLVAPKVRQEVNGGGRSWPAPGARGASVALQGVEGGAIMPEDWRRGLVYSVVS